MHGSTTYVRIIVSTENKEFCFTQIEFGSVLYDQILDLRNRLLRIPLGLEFRVRDIEKEWQEFHFGLISQDQEMVACLTLRSLGDQVIKMRQVAVETGWQSKGIGKALVKATEEWCRERGFSSLELNARDTAVPFYKKLGYSTIGESFTEVGIKHVKMKKNL